MSQENKDPKWEGKSIVELKNIKAEQLWPLFEDFCTFHKWIPGLDSEKCHYVEGVYGEPGLIRCNVFTEQSSETLSNDTDKWCTEKLLSMDRIEQTLSYKIIENNLGFRYYVGTIKVIEIEEGCKIEWSFIADPVEGMRLEDLGGFVEGVYGP
ncbi:lachrymatory-factor synthase-like [Bidens hawaiensis]|uniref:lachrymatory-factor synthase-like n=1 Tax=Bidens hawaiensis TaxID=980011 RepID=UPI00404B68A9